MLRFVLYVFSLVVSVAAYTEIGHIELNGAHMIYTGPTNYAIASPSLLQNNWKTVSVNGNNFIAVAPTCETVTKDLNALSNAEKGLIQNAKTQLESINSPSFHTPTNGNFKAISARYSLDGSRSSSTVSGTSGQSSYQNGGYSISKSDDNNFSLMKPTMNNNMARIFVSNDFLSIVYRDGTVKMKPINCLSPEEQQLVQESRLLVQQAEQQFQQRMQIFNQNMQNMQQNLQQNMHDLEQRMQNMFGNGIFRGNNLNVMNDSTLSMSQQPYLQQQPFQQQQIFQQQVPSQTYQQMAPVPLGGLQGSNFMNSYAPVNIPYNMYNPFASNYMRPTYSPYGPQVSLGNMNAQFGYGY